jgi:hypothetical protein
MDNSYPFTEALPFHINEKSVTNLFGWWFLVRKVVSHYPSRFYEQKCINIEMQVILLEVDF